MESTADIRVARLAWIALISTALPSIFDTEWKVGFGAGSVYLSDILLAWAAYRVFRLRHTPLPVFLVGIGALAVCVGFAKAESLANVPRDSRPFFYLLAGFYLATFLVQLGRRAQWRFGIKLATVVLGVSAAMAVITTTTHVPVIGGKASVQNFIYIGGRNLELSSGRIQSEVVGLALLAVVASIACYVRGVRLPTFDQGLAGWWFVCAVSAVAITILSYSRNSVLGISAGLFIAFLLPSASGLFSRVLRLLSLACSLVAVGAVIYYLAQQFGVFQNVIDTFSTRVLAGIAPDALGNDPSVGWRYTETGLARSFIYDNPLLGSGFGGYYRGRVLGEPFSNNDGRIYLHNFYLGIVVKLGLLGGVYFIGFIIFCLSRAMNVCGALRRAPDVIGVAACCLVSVCAISTVTPALFSRSQGALAGALLGVCWMARALASSAAPQGSSSSSSGL